MASKFTIPVVAALLLLPSATNCSDDSSTEAQIKHVRVGFDGQFKVGFWTPVRVTISGLNESFDGGLELIAPDSDGVLATYSKQVRIEPVEESTHILYAKFGRVDGVSTVRLRVDGRIIVSRQFTLSELGNPATSTDVLVVTLGLDAGVGEAARLLRRAASHGGQTIAGRVERAADLPNRWFGYEGVDTLILTTSRTGLLDQLNGQQIDALVLWVKLGGRLVVTAGRRGEEVFGPEGRLAELAPGRFVEEIDLTKTPGLETYAAASQPLDAAAGDEFRLPMSLFRDVKGRVEAYEGRGPEDRPVVVRYPLAMGQVVFVAIDLDAPPCASWQGRARLVAKLVQGRAGEERAADERRSGEVAHVGYTDMIGQLRAALDQFTGVTLVRFFWVAALIVVYVVLIGPGDYFLLKRGLRRMELTWITFPLILLLFCAFAVLLANVWKGGRLRINQVDLVDVDLESSVVRGTMWNHVFSPEMSHYDFSLQPESRAANEARAGGYLLSWQGLPGSGLGGMNTRATATLFNEAYSINSDNPLVGATQPAIAGMPVPISSTKTLYGQWWTTLDLSNVAQLKANENGLLEGRVGNPLPVELSDCRLFYDVWAYRFEERLGPGETFRIRELPPPRNLEWRLTQRTVVETKDVTTPWDQESADVPRILEMMMFHNAAGGEAYTELTHRYQDLTDLSDHLRTGRAVLVGRAASRASDLLRDGESLADDYDRHWTFFRIVFPVEQVAKRVD